MRLIDAEMYCTELYNEMNYPGRSEEFMTAIDVAIADLADAPIVDVAPVRHGRWEKQSGLYSCSECGMTCPYDVQADVIEYWACNYCPNCGAKMDGVLTDGC